MKFFVSGTDTNIGKTAATGWLARRYAERGLKVATQKLVQTGCGGISEDILEHRRIMGCGVLPCDADFTTCRYVFKYPASPHLAAAMEGATLDFDALASDTAKLEEAFDVVLVEGAGGLGVPLKEGFTTADYIAKYAMPLWLVVPSKLGSLSHALMSLEYCASRGIKLAGIVYNTFPKAPAEIEKSTCEYLAAELARSWKGAELLELGELK